MQTIKDALRQDGVWQAVAKRNGGTEAQGAGAAARLKAPGQGGVSRLDT